MAELANLVQRLELAVGRLEAMSSPGGGNEASAGGAVSASVEAFDEIIGGPLNQYYSQSKQIGGDVLKHAEMIKRAFASQRQVIVTASTSQKPPDAVLGAIIRPISTEVENVQMLREMNRTSPFFNHLSAVSESVPALGWITVSPKPGPYVKEMQDAAMFYTNRVLKEFKDKDKMHMDWVRSYLMMWTQVQNYIKQYHTTGLSWSKTGPVASASASAAPASSKPGGCAPPPPPPPGPPPPPVDLGGSTGHGDSDGIDRNALFESINKGSDITKGLRHVQDEDKTHKNPGLRAQNPSVRTGPKPFSSPSPRATTSAAPARSTQPPILELDGKKWKVENQEGAQGLVISETELKQVVYAFKCNSSTLQVKGKLNSITIDNCKKMGLVFDDVVGIVDIINSRDVKVQVLGRVPIISINKTDGCHVYLSPNSLGCEIISAKSSEMNILVPGRDGEFSEFAVPEQFKTVWDGAKLVTTVTDITA
ncbi:adenylyl cyclase-associated protein 1 isoform X2 [Festucalex cinctus]